MHVRETRRQVYPTHWKLQDLSPIMEPMENSFRFLKSIRPWNRMPCLNFRQVLFPSVSYYQLRGSSAGEAVKSEGEDHKAPESGM